MCLFIVRGSVYKYCLSIALINRLIETIKLGIIGNDLYTCFIKNISFFFVFCFFVFLFFYYIRNVDLFTFSIIYSSISVLLLEKELWSPSTGLTPLHFCACSKLGPGFPSSYVVVFRHKHQLSSMIHGINAKHDIVCILILTV